MRALLLGTLVIVALAVSALLDPSSGLAIWLDLKDDLVGAQARVARLERSNAALRHELAVLAADDGAIERAIREELDLALPGEIVVRFVDEGGAR